MGERARAPFLQLWSLHHWHFTVTMGQGLVEERLVSLLQRGQQKEPESQLQGQCIKDVTWMEGFSWRWHIKPLTYKAQEILPLELGLGRFSWSKSHSLLHAVIQLCAAALCPEVSAFQRWSWRHTAWCCVAGGRGYTNAACCSQENQVNCSPLNESSLSHLHYLILWQQMIFRNAFKPQIKSTPPSWRSCSVLSICIFQPMNTV